MWRYDASIIEKRRRPNEDWDSMDETRKHWIEKLMSVK